MMAPFMALVTAQFLLFVSVAWAKEPHRAAPVQEGPVIPSATLADWKLPAYVGVVLDSSQPGTIGNPPSSRVEVQQTLRGAPLSGVKHVVWTHLTTVVSAVDSDCNTQPHHEERVCVNEPRQLELAETIDPPMPGQKFLIFTMTPENVARSIGLSSTIPGIAEVLQKENAVVGLLAYPASAESMASFRRYPLLEEPFARRYKQQLANALFAFSLAAVFFVVFAPKTSLVACALMYLSYIMYESGTTPGVYMFSEMLIFIPWMAIGSIAAFISLVRICKAQSPSIASKHGATDQSAANQSEKETKL